MLPTLNGDERGRVDVTVVDHVAAMSGNLRPGDVVQLRAPNGRRVCKRILGVGDDIIEAKVPDAQGERRPKRIRVPRGYAWVEGDNPDFSVDSRTYGPVPVASIEGRVFATLYPRLRLMPRSFEHVESGPPVRLRHLHADGERPARS